MNKVDKSNLDADIVELAEIQARETTDELLRDNVYPNMTKDEIYKRELQRELQRELELQRERYRQLNINSEKKYWPANIQDIAARSNTGKKVTSQERNQLNAFLESPERATMYGEIIDTNILK